MSLHPSFGPFDASKIQQWHTAPVGEALKEIRLVDPLYGYSAGSSNIRKFEITVETETTITKQARFEVSAENEEAAKSMAEACMGNWTFISKLEFHTSAEKDSDEYKVISATESDE